MKKRYYFSFLFALLLLFYGMTLKAHSFISSTDAISAIKSVVNQNTNKSASMDSNPITSSALNDLQCLSKDISRGPVIADFDYSIGGECIPALVNFYNTSSGATTYNWSFPGGDPSTSTYENPIIIYLNNGTYTVTLVVSDGTTSDTLTETITLDLRPYPIPDFTYTKVENHVDFLNLSLWADSYTWNFGDGSPLSYEENPSHDYASYGVYTVSLTAWSNCEVIRKFVEIEIFALPDVKFTANTVIGCNPLTVTFMNLTDNGVTNNWYFPGGTPSTSSESDPVVVYDEAGIYDVTLEVTNSIGTTTLTEASYITVNLSPIAGFTYVLNGSQATFTDSSFYGTNYSWDFGDGSSSSDQNPVHTYLENGTFIVTQTVINGCPFKTETKTIVLLLPPDPSFTSDYTDPICKGESVAFTSTSSFSPTSYLWTFEGGTPSTSTLANPDIQYNTGGIYNVTLSVTNTYGSSELVLDDFIVVEEEPVVSFTYRADGLKLDFTQNISGSNDQNWDFGDGQTSTESNPSHTYLDKGNYIITLSAQNRCGVTEYSRNVEVSLFPTADFDATITAICPGGNVQFNNLSSQSVTAWQWTFEGGTPVSSSEENPIITYNDPGVYNVTLIVTNPLGQDTITKVEFISVLTPVTATFTGIISDNEIHLTNTGIGSNNSDWHIFNDELSEFLSGDSTIFVAPSNGLYNVVLTNTDLCGQAVSDTVQFLITAYPTASFTVNGGGVLCADSIVNFVGIGGDSYTWEFEGGSPSTSTDSNPSVHYAISGSYSVTLIASNNFGTDTLHTIVNVSTRPTADFDFNVLGSTVEFTSTSSGQTGQLWEFGDTTSSNEENPSHTYSSNGDYLVTLFASNGCGIDTTTQLVSITLVSVSDLQNEYGIKIYPNPANEFIQIQMTKNFASEYKLELLNSTGIVVKEKQFTATSDLTATLDVTDIKSGMYILNIKSNKIVIPYKIFILR